VRGFPALLLHSQCAKRLPPRTAALPGHSIGSREVVELVDAVKAVAAGHVGFGEELEVVVAAQGYADGLPVT